MKHLLQNPYLHLIARIVVGIIFIMYAIDKISTPKDFSHSIMNYKMVPEFAVNMLALVLPWVELITGMMLVLGVRLRAASLLASLMLVMFIMAIGVAMMRGLEINCGCSATSETVGWGKIGEDFAYLVLSLLIYFAPQRQFTLESAVKGGEPAADIPLEPAS